jgi:hypothetical protein
MVDFSQIPDWATRRQVEALRELATLFHLVDGGVGERHEVTQLLTANSGFGFDYFNGQMGKHNQSPECGC